VADAGMVSSPQPQKIRPRRAVVNLDEAGRDPRDPLIFDPKPPAACPPASPATGSTTA